MKILMVLLSCMFAVSCGSADEDGTKTYNPTWPTVTHSSLPTPGEGGGGLVIERSATAISRAYIQLGASGIDGTIVWHLGVQLDFGTNKDLLRRFLSSEAVTLNAQVELIRDDGESETRPVLTALLKTDGEQDVLRLQLGATENAPEEGEVVFEGELRSGCTCTVVAECGGDNVCTPTTCSEDEYLTICAQSTLEEELGFGLPGYRIQH